MDNKQESTHTEKIILEYLGVPIREPQTAEEVDACLRYYGYDPEKVGYTGKVFAEICIKNVKLRDALEHLADLGNYHLDNFDNYVLDEIVDGQYREITAWAYAAKSLDETLTK